MASSILSAIIIFLKNCSGFQCRIIDIFGPLGLSIHISRDGQEFGPYPEETVREHFEAGRFLPSDLAWHEGAKDWVPLGELLAVTASSDSVEEQKIRVNRGES